VVVLVGPTGVGKTTTIAKLAARAKLAEGRRIGLVTLDTFRIAAVDQLQKYAGIIGLPLAVAADPVELQAAVKSLARDGAEVVFVDSAGRSQRDELKMAELREFLGALPGAEVHLVLSTTTHPKTVRSVAERFTAAGYRRVILTKLDEAASFGALLEPLLGIGKPVSYITDGQNVPDDIMASDPERLVELVLRTAKG
jgi:flagellar biosynthesis protein FlhF